MNLVIRSLGMDFNFKKMASEAGGFFSRAKQFTEETFLKAERTELDAHFEHLLLRADKTEEHTRRLLSCIESYLQPNPTVRMEEVFYEKLELRKDGVGRLNNLEHLAQAMRDAGEEFGATTPYGSALLKVSQTEQKLGQAEREFVNQSASQTLLPIRRFLEGDMKTIQKERKVLNSKRLDLDACKSRLRKAKTMESQASANNKTSSGFSLEQTEADLRVAQAEFDKQSEITKLLLEGIQTAHNNQLKCLRDFVEAQMSFFAQSHQMMADLQRELSGSLSDSGIGLYSNSPPTVARSGPAPLTTAGEDLKTLTFRGSSAVLVSTLPAANAAKGVLTDRGVAMKELNTDHMGTMQARAILDYDAMMPNEISVKQNDILIVYRLPGLDPDFIMAEKGGVRGKIPLSFLEII